MSLLGGRHIKFEAADIIDSYQRATYIAQTAVSARNNDPGSISACSWHLVDLTRRSSTISVLKLNSFCALFTFALLTRKLLEKSLLYIFLKIHHCQIVFSNLTYNKIPLIELNHLIFIVL